ncbi:hypothetical protein CANCADRAFT_25585, partial [Tortispora caseinolytica NRRL Y-17796]
MAEESYPKRRNRIPVSCAPCRLRKLKCDRSRPNCGSCMRRGIIDLCIYEEKSRLQKYENSDIK